MKIFLVIFLIPLFSLGHKEHIEKIKKLSAEIECLYGTIRLGHIRYLMDTHSNIKEQQEIRIKYSGEFTKKRNEILKRFQSEKDDEITYSEWCEQDKQIITDFHHEILMRYYNTQKIK